jgi:MFS family permease
MNQNRKHLLLYMVFLGVGYLWVAASYRSQMHLLEAFYSAETLDRIALYGNYLAQVAGTGAFAAWLWKAPAAAASGRTVPAFSLSTAALAIAVTHLAGNAAVIVAGVIVTNFLVGVISAYYFSYLAGRIPGRHHGKAFAIPFAVSYLGAYVLAMADLLTWKPVFILYLVLIAVNLLLLPRLGDIPAPAAEPVSRPAVSARREIARLIPVFALTAIFLGIAQNLEYYAHNDADVSNILYAPLYVAGLVAGGLLFDANRKPVALAAFLSPLFPLFSAAAADGNPAVLNAAVALAGLFAGAFGVFRVTGFTVPAGMSPVLLPLAGIGMGLNRLGDTVGFAVSGQIYGGSVAITVLPLAAVLLVLLLFMFFVWLRGASSDRTSSDPAPTEHTAKS